MPEPLLTRYLQPLLAGRRAECFELFGNAVRDGWQAERLLCDVLWPAMAQVERLYHDDRINIAVEHLASRINRTLADQLQAQLPKNAWCGRRIVVACADGFREEAGAQVVSDLFQSTGWEVYFLGGGVPDDELLTLVGQLRPHTLLLFGTEPQAVPAVRQLIELIREIGVCPTMNIVVSGGVFNRAEGLWQEVGADASAIDVREVLELVTSLPARTPGPPKRGTVKKRQRRRRRPVSVLTQSMSKSDPFFTGATPLPPIAVTPTARVGVANSSAAAAATAGVATALPRV